VDRVVLAKNLFALSRVFALISLACGDNTIGGSEQWANPGRYSAAQRGQIMTCRVYYAKFKNPVGSQSAMYRTLTQSEDCSLAIPRCSSTKFNNDRVYLFCHDTLRETL
jgi:hypothetical protein